jgi:hypothetical protein
MLTIENEFNEHLNPEFSNSFEYPLLTEESAHIVNFNVALTDTEIITIKIEAIGNMTIEDLMKEGVFKTNVLLENKEKYFRFDTDITKYSLKASKKSGHPKEEPPLLLSSNVISTGISSFSLIYNKDSMVQQKKPSKCLRCLIF